MFPVFIDQCQVRRILLPFAAKQVIINLFRLDPSMIDFQSISSSLLLTSSSRATNLIAWWHRRMLHGLLVTWLLQLAIEKQWFWGRIQTRIFQRRHRSFQKSKDWSALLWLEDARGQGPLWQIRNSRSNSPVSIRSDARLHEGVSDRKIHYCDP